MCVSVRLCVREIRPELDICNGFYHSCVAALDPHFLEISSQTGIPATSEVLSLKFTTIHQRNTEILTKSQDVRSLQPPGDTKSTYRN